MIGLYWKKSLRNDFIIVNLPKAHKTNDKHFFYNNFYRKTDGIIKIPSAFFKIMIYFLLE